MFRKIATLVALLLCVVIVSSAEWHPPPEAVIDTDPEIGDFLAGVPVQLSAHRCLYTFDFDHELLWSDNGIPISDKKTFERPFREGDHDLELKVKTPHGTHTAKLYFHVRENPPPDLNGSLEYFDPYEERFVVSYKSIKIPQHGSFEVLFKDLNDRRADDGISFTVDITPDNEGLEIIDSRVRSRDGSLELFAWEPGTYSILVGGTDEAGQTHSLEFTVVVGNAKAIELEAPTEVDERELFEITTLHPCPDTVCDYVITIEHWLEGEEDDSGSLARHRFDDEGPANVTVRVVLFENELASAFAEIWVRNSENDPPMVETEISPDRPQAGKPITANFSVYDDGHNVQSIFIRIWGDSDHTEPKWTKVPLIKEKGTHTFTPTRDTEYTIERKCCDGGGECFEEDLEFDVSAPFEEEDQDPGDGQDDGEEKAEEELSFLSACTTLAILLFAVVKYRSKVNHGLVGLETKKGRGDVYE